MSHYLILAVLAVVASLLLAYEGYFAGKERSAISTGLYLLLAAFLLANATTSLVLSVPETAWILPWILDRLTNPAYTLGWTTIAAAGAGGALLAAAGVIIFTLFGLALTHILDWTLSDRGK